MSRPVEIWKRQRGNGKSKQMRISSIRHSCENCSPLTHHHIFDQKTKSSDGHFYLLEWEENEKIQLDVKIAKTKKKWSLGSCWIIAAGAYPRFCSMKRLGIFLLPLDGMLVWSQVIPSKFVRFPQQFAATHLYSWVERGTMRVKFSCPRTKSLGISQLVHSIFSPDILSNALGLWIWLFLNFTWKNKKEKLLSVKWCL